MSTDALDTRARALVSKLGKMAWRVQSPLEDYAQAAEDVRARKHDAGDDHDVAGEMTRHAEAMLVLRRRKLEEACAEVEKGLRAP